MNLDDATPIVTVLLATIAVVVALRAESRLHQERAEAVSTQVQDQASRVSSWLVREAPGDPHYDGPDDFDGNACNLEQIVIYIENASSLPVFEVRVDWYPTGFVDAILADDADLLKLLDADHYDYDLGDDMRKSECVWVMDVLPPSTKRRCVVDTAAPDNEVQSRVTTQMPSTSLAFNDTRGVRWFRNYAGALSRADFAALEPFAGTFRGRILDRVENATGAVYTWTWLAFGGRRAVSRAADRPRCPRT